MKALLEFIPLVLFLVIYKMTPRELSVAGFDFTLGGIYSATAVLMVGTVIGYAIEWSKQKKLTNMQWIVVGGVLIFGSSTLLLRSEAILMWKAPIINWVMGGIFLWSQYFGETTVAQKMFGELVTMPKERWKVLNLGWVFVFLLDGCANLYVAFNHPQYWVDFKVWGGMGILLIASIAQIFYIYPYLNAEAVAATADDEKAV
jgi:intracellular septation protein